MRLFCLFAAPPERDFDWTDTGIEGAYRFVNRVWHLFADLQGVLQPVRACSDLAPAASEAVRSLRYVEHSVVKKVGDDIALRNQFNTAIAAIMELVNAVAKYQAELSQAEEGRRALSSAMASVLTLLYPFTPHMCEEIWQALGHAEAMDAEPWPQWSGDALVTATSTVVVQVNGKLRGRIEVPTGSGSDVLEKAALEDPAVSRHLQGKTVLKVVVVPERLVNIVVR